MTDRPIIFSGPMVKALLAGHKAQTRRLVRDMPEPPGHDSVVHPNPKHEHPYFDAYCGKKRTPENPRGMSDYWCWWTRDDREGRGCRIGYVPGDRLWVRERGWISESGLAFQPFVGNEEDAPRSPSGEPYKPRPSIHMPRWASRLTLIVENVRVEQLGLISRGDAIAEGIQRVGGGMLRWEKWSGAEAQSATSPELAYAMLWNSLHGANAWNANPFVVALTFRVVHENIDRIVA